MDTTRIPKDALREIGDLKRRLEHFEAVVYNRIDRPLGAYNSGYVLGGTLYFATNDTFDKAEFPGLRAVESDAQGGGGGGGGASVDETVGGGGAAGSMGRRFVLVANLATSETVTVGGSAAGGAAGSGASGNDSSFGTHAIGPGGNGGTANGGAPAASVAATGDFTRNGQNGGAGGANADSANGDGGSSFYGGGGRMRQKGAGGDAGRSYGGGGAGGHRSITTNRNGGDGAPGIVIVRLYY